MAHYDGSSWSLVSQSFTTDGLEDVWSSSATDVWAVGDYSVILHYDGVLWREVNPVTTGGKEFRSVWGISPSDIWSVGPGAHIGHITPK